MLMGADGPHSADRHGSGKIPLHRRKAFRLILLAKLFGIAVALVMLHEVQVKFGMGAVALALLHVVVVGALLFYAGKRRPQRGQSTHNS